MAKLIELNLWDLAVIGGLVMIIAGLFFWLRLELVGALLLATARVMLQVLMLGIFGTLVFQASQPWGVLGGIVVMLLGVSIATSHRMGQPRLLLLLGGSLGISTLAVTAYTQLLVVHPPAWYSPQYLLAWAGILLASSPAVVLSAGQRFLQIIKQEREAIETRLSLGASAGQALRPYQRLALHQSLQPAIQNLAVSGLIAIPTLMAGLMLAGMPPLLAAAYQIVALLMVIVHQSLTAILVVQGLSRYACPRHQLMVGTDLLEQIGWVPFI